MKQTLCRLGMFLALLSTMVLPAHAVTPGTISGSKELVNLTLAVEPFEAIDASRGIKVVLVDAATLPDSLSNRLQVEINANLADHLIATTEKGCLRLSLDSWSRSFTRLHAQVTVPIHQPLSSIDASSAAWIRTEGLQLNCETMRLEASSAAEMDLRLVVAANCSISATSAAAIRLDLTTSTCTLNGSSAAKIELQGKAERCSATLNSAASLEASRFEMANGDISTASGASARILCTEYLKAKASSGGSIRYAGDCRIDPDIAISGSLSR